MVNNITSEQTAKISSFVEGLAGRTREIASEFLSIPNIPDSQPEFLELYFTYGKELSTLTEQLENLRQDLSVSYDVFQSELQKRLYH